eukprot:evm.model.scf_1505.3 EVM.evm.TU.scf_1505.3   scf_1505:14095-15887(+)
MATVEGSQQQVAMEGPFVGWDALCLHLLETMQGALEADCGNCYQFLKRVRGTRRDWRAWADKTTRSLRPGGGGTRLQHMVSAMAARFPNLESLSLSPRLAVTNADLEAAPLGDLPALTALDLSGCSRLSDVGVEHLSRLQHLRDLRLDNCRRVSDQGLAALGCHTGLTRLSLRGCLTLTDEGLAGLKPFVSLTSLSLAGCKSLGIDGVRHVAALPRLRRLDLGQCASISDNCLWVLRTEGLPRTLQELGLANCSRVTDAGVRHVGALTSLTALDLTRCKQVGDEGVGGLAALGLKDLSLQGCRNLSDRGLAALERVTSLSSVDLSDCARVTEGGVARLVEAMGAGVTWDVRHLGRGCNALGEEMEDNYFGSMTFWDPDT